MIGSISIHTLVVVIITMLISVTLHEVMHALVAHKLGDTTAKDAGRITLNPLQHIDLLTTIILPVLMLIVGVPPIFIAKPVPFDPDRVRHGDFGAAMVALAGPFTNLLLAALAAGVLNATGFHGQFSLDVLVFISINVSLFVFNMIPFPPLDGSRLLYAFAPEPLQRVMLQIEQMGFAVIIIVFVLLARFIGPIVTNISTSIMDFLIR